MLNIKKQINLLYITSILGSLSVTGAWVAILSSRGFSLVQIGIAETVFHITSLIFEIPSGILADRYGRKRNFHVMCRHGAFYGLQAGIYHKRAYTFGDIADHLQAGGSKSGVRRDRRRGRL